jgi:hypothetical protein
VLGKKNSYKKSPSKKFSIENFCKKKQQLRTQVGTVKKRVVQPHNTKFISIFTQLAL